MLDTAPAFSDGSVAKAGVTKLYAQSHYLMTVCQLMHSWPQLIEAHERTSYAPSVFKT